MKKWLLTVEKKVDLAAVLRAWECELDPDVPPVPHEDDTQTMGVIGPDDLAERVYPSVRVYPNSRMELYPQELSPGGVEGTHVVTDERGGDDRMLAREGAHD